MNSPLVSICIPTYNGEKYLQEALDSVREQTYKNIELVISDDASTDRTLEIVEAFRKNNPIPTRILHHQPAGIGANWNNCIAFAKGDYIKFLFQDDVLMPNCVSAMLAILEASPEVALVSSKREFIVESGPTTSINEWIKKFKNLQAEFQSDKDVDLIDHTMMSQPWFLSPLKNKIGEPSCTMFRTEIIRQTGLFDEHLKQILDYVFYYRILKFAKIAIINRSLVKFRLHLEQATSVNSKTQIMDYQHYNRILYKEFFPYLHADIQLKLKNKFGLSARIMRKLKRYLGRHD
ncbi:glycosyltransferase family 2 protein [Nonlabens xiamenensis]|uniref:glycosyltransferase family 2 protein n=1 Tax=Nonlabens xiamenensis TaxID=2341043 RepID=UPI000F610FA3|nr:glycosyltransferase [Nonlabens xiamenensis]